MRTAWGDLKEMNDNVIFKRHFPFTVFPLWVIGLETQNCHVHLHKVEWKNTDQKKKKNPQHARDNYDEVNFNFSSMLVKIFKLV